MTRSILRELEARGQIQNSTDRDALDELLCSGCVPFYVGYDPTGTSLHVGSLVPTILMARLQRAGHKPYCLVGGATGMVGDPSGKSEERSLLDRDQLAANVDAIRKQLEPFLEFGSSNNAALMVNNHDWFGEISFLEFLRDVGKHLTVNYMMAKESVRTRLSDRDQGISYTEFSYMLLQAYDYHVLADRYGCRLQAGGSDQWGNITAGIELHRRMGGKAQLHGLTAPLLLDANGNKMGKTAAGTAVWLDPEKTSPYAFYQYWLNVPDADVERLMKLFSWRGLDEIDTIVAEHTAAPERRDGQKALADDVTAWVHGAPGLKAAQAATQVMFGGALDELRDADLAPLLADVQSSELARGELETGIELAELLRRTGLAKSKGAARRLISGGGVYVNNIREGEVGRSLTTADLATETMLVLRSGKKSYHIVKVA